MEKSRVSSVLNIASVVSCLNKSPSILNSFSLLTMRSSVSFPILFYDAKHTMFLKMESSIVLYLYDKP
jgi:hypothetical protein